jgi:hypothetical protein
LDDIQGYRALFSTLPTRRARKNLDLTIPSVSTSHVSASYDTLLSRSLCSRGDEAEGVMSAPLNPAGLENSELSTGDYASSFADSLTVGFESESESIITQPAAPNPAAAPEIDVGLALRDYQAAVSRLS